MLVEANLHPFAISPPVMSTLIKNLYCLKPGEPLDFPLADVQDHRCFGLCFCNVQTEGDEARLALRKNMKDIKSITPSEFVKVKHVSLFSFVCDYLQIT